LKTAAADFARRDRFPVSNAKFPVNLQTIPCYVAQGIYLQLIDITAYPDQASPRKIEITAISLFFSLLAGNFGLRRLVSPDCIRHHPVPSFYNSCVPR
jgi:hypothetical protein